MKLFPSAMLILAALGFSEEWKLGYDLSANQKGYTHFLSGSKSEEYFDIGLKLGYGTSAQFVSAVKSDSATGSKTTLLNAYGNKAFKVNVPLRAKYHRWPYLLAELSYERLTAFDPYLKENGQSGFAKSNDLFLYPGLGYEVTFKNRFSIYLAGSTRYALMVTDKSKYFRVSNPSSGNGTFQTVKIDPTLGSKVFWDVGLNFLF
jgi:hypothetical protein